MCCSIALCCLTVATVEHTPTEPLVQTGGFVVSSLDRLLNDPRWQGDANAVALPLHVATDVDFRLLSCVPTMPATPAGTTSDNCVRAFC